MSTNYPIISPINYYVAPLRSPSAQRPGNLPDRVVQRRVGVNGAITQVEFGSDGASRTIDTPAPNLFDLFGSLSAAPPPAPRPPPTDTAHSAQEALADQAATRDKALEKAAPTPDQPDADEAEAADEAEHTSADAPAEGERDGSTPSLFQPPSPANTPSTDVHARSAALHQLVSKLSVRLSVQDSRAEIALDALIGGFPSTVVTMQQIGARLQVTVRCNSQAEADWFAQHGEALSRLLSERLHRAVDLAMDDHTTTGDAATEAVSEAVSDTAGHPATKTQEGQDAIG